MANESIRWFFLPDPIHTKTSEQKQIMSYTHKAARIIFICPLVKTPPKLEVFLHLDLGEY
ncbi:hypothetical protein VCRA2123E76_290001 [Vibrio crassostreae]|nr:hypothetical protein VCRA2123E76_290001 [Vibrio crassostreae]